MLNFSKYILVLCCLLTLGCNSKNETETPVVVEVDTSKPQRDHKKPDPAIAVKDDFTALTKADEEQEDKTHMDMSYFPSNYALTKANNVPVQLQIRVTYSRPHKRDRPIIFGDSTAPVPYGKLWRLGANETTEIEFLRPVIVNNKRINAGRYSLYAIPKKENWTIIVNSDLYTWGDFNYDNKKDMVRAVVPVNKGKFSLETFLIYFQRTSTGCNMIMSWDDVIVALPITLV